MIYFLKVLSLFLPSLATINPNNFLFYVQAKQLFKNIILTQFSRQVISFFFTPAAIIYIFSQVAKFMPAFSSSLQQKFICFLISTPESYFFISIFATKTLMQSDIHLHIFIQTYFPTIDNSLFQLVVFYYNDLFINFIHLKLNFIKYMAAYQSQNYFTIFLYYYFLINLQQSLYNQQQIKKGKVMNKKQHKKLQRFVDVPQLIQRIEEESPKSGQYFYDYKLEEAKKEQNLLNDDQFHKKYKINFADLPISQACIRGLTNRKFVKMTQIQRCVIPHALANRDIMAASRTGSGKTLCYLIPLIEKLYRHKFIPMDGLGGIVIVPVRQLAIQVFQVLNSFTSNIQISVGLIIGGKSVQYQKQKITNMNILVCTPGRLLQHLQQTYGFETNNLQMLIIDEADVMMEMGFQTTLKAIMEHLPKCQTLLFSATLTNQISLLANISMNNPQKIFLHSKQSIQNISEAQNIYETPTKLTQYYMIVQPHQKVNTLYSFLKTHQRQKIIVFVSTCKQVRFIYQSFKKFRLGLPMYELQGHQKQKKRMAIYFTFCQKKYGLLISTNIASRGLDFPMIDWVIQFDIPQNTETYVHRIGRTARFKYQGKSLTFVSEPQLKFIQQLKSKNIRLHKIKQNPQKYLRIESSLQSICSEHQDVKYLAQKALVSYLKFVYKSSNKAVFNIKNIDSTKLAESFGLQNAPIISIKNHAQDNEQDQEGTKMTKIEKMRMKAKMKKNQIKKQKLKKLQQKQEEQEDQQDQLNQDDEENIQELEEQQQQQEQQYDTQNNKNQQLLKVKQKHIPNPKQKPILTVSKNRLKKVRNQGIFDGKNKTHFDEQFNPISDQQFLRRQYLKENQKNTLIERDFSNKISQNKQIDESIQKKRRRQKRIKIQDQLKQYKGQILPNRSKSKIIKFDQSDEEREEIQE